MCYQALDCINPGMWAHKADGQGKAPWHSLPWHLPDKGLHQGLRCHRGAENFIFHRRFSNAESSRVLSFCQSLSALHSQCLSPHSLAGGGVRSLGKSHRRGSASRAACRAVGRAASLSAPLSCSPFLEVLTGSIQILAKPIHRSRRLPQALNPAESDPKLSISKKSHPRRWRWHSRNSAGFLGDRQAALCLWEGECASSNYRCFLLPSFS